MKKTKARGIAFLLCLSFLIGLTGCGLLRIPKTSLPGSDPDPDRNTPESIRHFNISLGDRARDSFDRDAFDGACDELDSLLKSEGNAERIFELYETIKKLLLDSKTDASLALYDYNTDIANAEKAERYASKQNEYSKIYGKSVGLLRSVFLTDYADAFRLYVGDGLADKLEKASTVSAEESAIKTKIRGLEKKYDTLMAQGADAAAYKELYIEIVNANNAYARLRGYSGYADYAYSKARGRDYTIEDLRGIENEVINSFIPVFRAYVAAATKDAVYDAYKENHDSGETKLTRLKNCVKNISPRLEESLDHLIRNRLYDMDFSDTKGQADYTVTLPTYNDAFIFINPQGKVSDYKTVLHEFGHFSAHYYRPCDAFDPNLVMDVEEIMSQGLQLLCYDYYGAYYEEYGAALTQSTVFQIMQAVPKGFAVNEAEYLSYTAADLTVEELDAIWAEANRKYGKPLGKTEDAWTAIPHVFQNPFYYIGYATSSLAAFELFAESREDFRGSVDKYLTITQLPAGTGLLEALKRAELNSFFEEGRITALSKELSAALKIRK